MMMYQALEFASREMNKIEEDFVAEALLECLEIIKKLDKINTPDDDGLKLCPICGGIAGLDGRDYDYFVSCQVCGLITLQQYTKEDAIESWNKRFVEQEGREIKKSDSLTIKANMLWSYYKTLTDEKEKQSVKSRVLELMKQSDELREKGE